jgi:curli biogenesis system outer membrane secretion channel CsgG
MNRKTLFLALAVLLPVLFASCASQSIVLKQGYDFKKIRRIAVVEFKDSAYYPSSGSMVSQLFAKYLLKAGYNLVERDELDSILREHNLALSNLMNPDQITQFKLSGIDAIVTGSIPMVVPEQNFYENGNPRFIAAQVGVTARMIDVQTGEILWIGSDTYDGTNTQTAFEYLVSSLVRQLVQDLKENALSQKVPR